jgi:hypothetical protein
VEIAGERLRAGRIFINVAAAGRWCRQCPA